MSLAEIIAAAVRGVVQPIIEQATRSVTDNADQSGAKTVEAIGAAGDAEIEQQRQIYSQRQRAALYPAPQSCVSAATGAAAHAAAATHAARRAAAGRATANAYVQGIGGPKIAHAIAAADARVREFAATNADVDASRFLPGGHYADGGAAARAYIDHAQARTLLALPVVAPGAVADAAPIKLEALAVAAAAGTAATVLDDARLARLADPRAAATLAAAVESEAANATTPGARQAAADARELIRDMQRDSRGLSSVDLLHYEIERRRGKAGWGESLNDYSAAPPLLREMCEMTALRNHMILSNIEQDEKIGVMQAIEILRQTADDAKALSRKYGIIQGARHD
ncbi:MAG: hypothetical protein EPN72_10835 [Nevskiaceae bacterium]|nr:MAG: hypothetical protein EPN63_05845 [Nevskiaceae bacterium]TBR72240.1 MAG: hypothetical protein EPN72_10835 [Nevskiaceae bacterium]